MCEDEAEENVTQRDPGRLMQIGMGFWANTLWCLLIAAISAALLVWGVISREELYLEGKFGTDYVAYKARVRRWL